MTIPELAIALRVVITVGCGIIVVMAFAGVIREVWGLFSGVDAEECSKIDVGYRECSGIKTGHRGIGGITLKPTTEARDSATHSFESDNNNNIKVPNS